MGNKYNNPGNVNLEALKSSFTNNGTVIRTRIKRSKNILLFEIKSRQIGIFFLRSASYG